MINNAQALVPPSTLQQKQQLFPSAEKSLDYRATSEFPLLTAGCQISRGKGLGEMDGTYCN